MAEVPLPVVGGYTGLGDGALFTIGGYEAAACPAKAGAQACRAEVEGSSFGAIAVKVVSGPSGQATIEHYLQTYPLYAALPVTPTSLINFGEAINFPLIFGVIVAIFGAGTLIHLLVVSVTRRRRETGLLKVLGFTNSPGDRGGELAGHHADSARARDRRAARRDLGPGDVDPVRSTARGRTCGHRPGVADRWSGARRRIDREPARHWPRGGGNTD